jgi:glycerol-1-phosphate dehydrogenase [NAD(P)+]
MRTADRVASAWPKLRRHAGALRACSGDWPVFTVITTPSPWRIAEPMLSRVPARVVFVPSLRRADLDQALALAEGSGLIVGIGSGTAMDAAKYISRHLEARLIQVPSTASNNACFTRACWVLEPGGRRAERPTPIPEAIIADPGLIGSAPASLNAAGIMEILCSHTALFDWELAHHAGRDVDWNEPLRDFAQGELDQLETLVPLVGAGDVEAYLDLLEADARFAPGFTAHPKARFNSASEHLFGWALEEQTGRRLVHGETVSLGILLMAHLQDNRPEWAARITLAARVPFRPEDIGVTWDEVMQTCAALPAFTHKLPWYSIIDVLAARDPSLTLLQNRCAAARDFVRGLG